MTLLLGVFISTIASVSVLTAAEPTTVSIQGRLSEAGMPSDGIVTLRLTLFDDADPLIGSKVDLDGDGTTQGADEDVIIRNITVSDGLFETDFGPLSSLAFDGTPRFLQVEVNGTPLNRVPFRSTPGVAETVVSPDGGTRLVVTTDTGGIGFGTASPTARLDVRPGETLTIGTVQSTSPDPGIGQTVVFRSPGYSPNSIVPGDIILGRSPDGQSAVYLGMVFEVDDGAGTLTTDFVANATINGWGIEVRQPVLRVAANPNADAYPAGELVRQGLIVADDGRVGINTRSPSAELEVNGELKASVASIAQALIASGSISAGDITAGSITADSLSGSFVSTQPSGANRVDYHLKIGDLLIFAGQVAVSSGNREPLITFPEPFADDYAVAIVGGAGGRVGYWTAKGTTSMRVSFWKVDTGVFQSLGSGSFIAIGRAANP